MIDVFRVESKHGLDNIKVGQQQGCVDGGEAARLRDTCLRADDQSCTSAGDTAPALAIAKFMQSVGRQYVRYVNAPYRRSGTLWEGRYKANLVDYERYVLRCHRYIELNPVRPGWSRTRLTTAGRVIGVTLGAGRMR
jgi:hypothetical protein